MKGHIGRASAYLSGEGLGPFLLRSVAGTGTVQISSLAAGFLVGVLLARGLGVGGFGYYAIAQSVITLAGIPSEMGVTRLVTREVAASMVHKDYPRFYGILRWADGLALGISALMLVGIVVAGTVIAEVRPSPLALALIVGAPIVPLMALGRIRGGALQGLHFIVRGQVPANLLRPVTQCMLLIGIYLLGLGLDPAGAMALNAAAAGLAFLVARHWLLQRRPPRTGAAPVREGRQWLASSVPMALTQGMLVLQFELSVLLVGFMVAPAEAGLFRVAGACTTAASAASPIVIHVAFPVFARLFAEKDWSRLQKSVTFFACIQFGGMLLLAAPLLIVPKLLLGLAFGGGFAAAATPLRLLLVGQIFNAAFGPNVVLLNMTRHERRVTRAMAIALALNLVAVPALTLRFGVAGAAVGLAASTFCWNVIVWADARRLLGIETNAVGGIAKWRRVA